MDLYYSPDYGNNWDKNQATKMNSFYASSLASGVYLYRLNVNDYVNVKKFILLK
jgi:hypothetical protein